MATDHAPSPRFIAGPGGVGCKLTVSDITANIDERARPLSVHDRQTGAVLLRVDSSYGTQLQVVSDPKGGVVAVIGSINTSNTIVVYSPHPLFDGQFPDAAASQGYGMYLYPWFSQLVEHVKATCASTA